MRTYTRNETYEVYQVNPTKEKNIADEVMQASVSPRWNGNKSMVEKRKEKKEKKNREEDSTEEGNFKAGRRLKAKSRRWRL